MFHFPVVVRFMDQASISSLSLFCLIEKKRCRANAPLEQFHYNSTYICCFFLHHLHLLPFREGLIVIFQGISTEIKKYYTEGTCNVIYIPLKEKVYSKWREFKKEWKQYSTNVCMCDTKFNRNWKYDYHLKNRNLIAARCTANLPFVIDFNEKKFFAMHFPYLSLHLQFMYRIVWFCERDQKYSNQVCWWNEQNKQQQQKQGKKSIIYFNSVKWRD